MEELGRIDTLEQLYGLFGDLIPNKMLAPVKKGVGSRDRDLPARVTFWAFVAQVMSPGMPCREVVRKVEAWWRWTQKDRSGSLSASAYCQARARLDPELLRLIAGQVSWTLDRNTLKSEHWLKGRSVKIVDGTTVSMPDTPENQGPWPQSSSQQPVVSAVCQLKGQSWEEFVDQKGDWGRDMALLVARKNTSLTNRELAKWLGDVDDSTVAQAVRRLQKRVETTTSLKEIYERLNSAMSYVKT